MKASLFEVARNRTPQFVSDCGFAAAHLRKGSAFPVVGI